MLLQDTITNSVHHSFSYYSLNSCKTMGKQHKMYITVECCFPSTVLQLLYCRLINLSYFMITFTLAYEIWIVKYICEIIFTVHVNCATLVSLNEANIEL